MPTFNCEVRLTFSGNESEAENINDYIKQTVDRFWAVNGIEIDESEIHDIQEIA